MTYEIVHAKLEDALPYCDEGEFDAVLCDPPYGLSFMGRCWDYDVPSVQVWAEALRVLKPGAPLLAFGGTRTYHRMVMNIEDGGFEIRDTIAWIYGSGFPKSQNISKQFEKGRREWDGYGTALKPALEPICVARKPLDGTMAANVVAHGVGGLNIDGTRIGEAGGTAKGTFPNQPSNGVYGNGLNGACEIVELNKGRWPANVILDEEAGAVMDAQTGNRPGMSGGGKHKADYAGGMFGGIDSTTTARGDNGGASRFFYCAKANRKEREAGCEGLPARAGFEAVEREEGSAGVQNPRAGAGRTAGQVRNFHPTVKPLDLCRYLAKLILPPKAGKILVPWAGSGSEMIGAWLAGWRDIVGIEMEADHVRIAEARLRHWAK